MRLFEPSGKVGLVTGTSVIDAGTANA